MQPCPPHPDTGAQVLRHLERDRVAANPTYEAAGPEKCQTHLGVPGHPAPLALVTWI